MAPFMLPFVCTCCSLLHANYAINAGKGRMLIRQVQASRISAFVVRTVTGYKLKDVGLSRHVHIQLELEPGVINQTVKATNVRTAAYINANPFLAVTNKLKLGGFNLAVLHSLS